VQAVDACQAEVVKVAHAQAAVDKIDDQLCSLAAELNWAPPAQKAQLAVEIRQLRQEALPTAMAALAAARRALQACRGRGEGLG